MCFRYVLSLLHPLIEIIRRNYDYFSDKTKFKVLYFKDKPCYAFPKNNIMEEEMLPTEDASIIDISNLPFGATTDAIE